MKRILIFLALLGLGMAAAAHPLAPGLLQITEDADAHEVLWRITALQAGNTIPRPVLPDHCQNLNEPQISLQKNAAITQQWRIDCGEPGLVGESISVDNLGRSGSNVILRYVDDAGRSSQQLITANQPLVSVEPPQTSLQILQRYVVLGIEHLILGPDHLLFLLGLLLLVTGWKRLILTLTAFTIGHSITLSLATLGLFTLPQSITELGIAISIVVLARELLSSRPSWVGRYPMAMAGGFGLLHGLGFAGVLGEIGLPQTEVVSGLLGFNLGIELAQLMIVAAFMPITFVVRKMRYKTIKHTIQRARPIPIYLMGALAVMWCIERAGQIEAVQRWAAAI